MKCCRVKPFPKLKDAAELSDVLKALSDETRLRILALLREGEMCVCHIHGGLRLPQPAVSRHLAYLKSAGLVEARRQGIWIHYKLASPQSPIIARLLDATLHALTHAASTSRDVERMRRKRHQSPAPVMPASA